MNSKEKKQREIFRQIQRQTPAQAGWIRRVQLGAKDYQSGAYEEQRWAFEAVVIEQKSPKSGQLPEVLSGARRFLCALSGRAFRCGADWGGLTLSEGPTYPLISDRLWLPEEARELKLFDEPVNLDSGIGALYELLVR